MHFVVKIFDIFIYLEDLTFGIYFRMGVAQLVGIFVVLVAIGVEASPFAKKVGLSIRLSIFGHFLVLSILMNQSRHQSINLYYKKVYF